MIDEDACWRWPGTHRPTDGRPTVSGEYVYRMVYQAAGGDMSLPLHHTCHNPWCINPRHLSSMPQSDHAKTHGHGGDWGQKDKTHCPNGHEYSEENTYMWNNWRLCRICRSEAKRRYNAKKKVRRV